MLEEVRNALMDQTAAFGTLKEAIQDLISKLGTSHIGF